MALSEKIQQQRNDLVNQIIIDIKEGKPLFWHEGYFNGEPKNLISSLKGKKQLYKGINNLFLTVAACRKGFTDSRWATFKQITDAGYKLKKGSKGTHIEYWQYTKDVMEINPKTGKKEPVYEIDPETGIKKKLQIPLKVPIVKNYVVFNAEQIENIEIETPPEIKHEDTIKSMENMLKHSEAKIYYDQDNRNYYSPSEDEIHVVPRDKFYNIDDFYATVSHEIAHSTGAKHRLNRETLVKNDGFGSISYAKEELRAELTSMFLSQKYNIKFGQQHYENHAAYLQSWVKVLQDDPNEVFRAASEAEKAMQYIEINMIGLKQEQILTQSNDNIVLSYLSNRINILEKQSNSLKNHMEELAKRFSQDKNSLIDSKYYSIKYKYDETFRKLKDTQDEKIRIQREQEKYDNVLSYLSKREETLKKQFISLDEQLKILVKQFSPRGRDGSDEHIREEYYRVLRHCQKIKEKMNDVYFERVRIQEEQENIIKQKSNNNKLNEVDRDKLTIIQNFKPKANNISTTQLYLKMAQNLLKEHDNIWQQDFNKKIVSELQNKGKNVFDIKQAIMKYSPVNIPVEELKNITKLSSNRSLSR